nr:P1 protein [Beet chlorosis virus]
MDTKLNSSYALFFFSSLILFGALGTMAPSYMVTGPLHAPKISSDFPLPPDITQLLLAQDSVWDCPLQKKLSDYSYKELVIHVLQRGYNDTQKYLPQLASMDFGKHWDTISGQFAGLNILERLMWGLIRLWGYVIWVVSSSTMGFLMNNLSLAIIVASLMALSVLMARAAQLFFKILQLCLPVLAARMVMSTFITMKRVCIERPKSYVKECAVRGFTTWAVPMKPPKSSILLISHDDGSHAGYATCVTLHDRQSTTIGLITCSHAPINGSVFSTVTGNKIKMESFKTLYDDAETDVKILFGPPNWESVMGCKALKLVTRDSLAKGPATIYTFGDNGWTSSQASIVGAYDKNKASVLSITDKGHSGAPYISGKNVIGIHSGGDVVDNVNVCSTIPKIVNLTTPRLVFETTAPQGRLFLEKEMDDLLEYDWSGQEARAIVKERFERGLYEGKGVKSYDFETTSDNVSYPIVPPHLPGNGLSGADRQTTGTLESIQSQMPACGDSSRHDLAATQPNFTPITQVAGTQMTPNQGVSVMTQATPSAPSVPSTEMELMGLLLNRINLENIEEKVAGLIAKNVQKLSRPRRRNLENFPRVNTGGAWVPPYRRSVGSKKSDPSPNSTTPNKDSIRNTELEWRKSTVSSKNSQQDLGGPSSVPKLN